MVRLIAWTGALVGCVTIFAAAGGEEVAPAESCEASTFSFPEDEFSVCNVGSSCREEYNQANGSVGNMWVESDDFDIAGKRLRSEKTRVKLNEYQPAIVPKYTEIGYKKEKLNPETFAYLMQWYENQIAAKEPVVESWPPDNTYVNHWKVDTTMSHSPRRIHTRLYEDLLPLMEEWTGLELKSTACYGVRHYYRGSILANHVDRVDTHVISAIINVAQTNVDTDWPLFVRGHDGVARNIFIEPGEIVFYESASVIHGRPEAFQGDRFANIFVHFAPVKGWHITANDVEMAARSGAYKKSREEAARNAEAAKTA